MNEEKTNLTVTIRGQYRDEEGNLRDLNEVFENMDAELLLRSVLNDDNPDESVGAE